jgi:glutaredoxin 3
MARPEFACGSGLISAVKPAIQTPNKGNTMSQVVLYGTRFCPFCTQARRLLTAKEIDFQDIPLDSNPELRAEIMERSSRNTVPQIWIGEEHIGGYTDLRQLDMQGELDSLVNAEG